jgi:hypothetical protein
MSVPKLVSLLRIEINSEENCPELYAKLQSKPVLKKIHSSEKYQWCGARERRTGGGSH